MAFLDIVTNFFKSPQKEIEVETSIDKKDPVADFSTSNTGQYRSLFSVSYNGEKNLGEIGPIKSYILDYYGLSLRSWESMLTNEISATVIAKFALWVIGSGLKLQAEPQTTVLQTEGIDLNSQDFAKIVEARFSVFCKSRMGDFSGRDNIHILSEKAFLNSIIGGDVLVILRYIDGCLKVQLIDGSHVQSPTYGNEINPLQLPNGNRIINGIELSPSNEEIAYHVRKSWPQLNFETEKIIAKSETTGLQMAFMVRGNDYRLDNYRGVPILSTVLETLAKLDRYKEAAVGSAEEAAKIAYQVVHQAFSTGENPFQNMAKAFDVDGANNSELPIDAQGKILANTVSVSTNKQAFNNPVGSKIETLDSSKRELAFAEFYGVNSGGVCGALSIPPEVAFSKYDSNFSASRAALKDWEHTLNVRRTKFTFFFLQHIYNFWLETEILKNKIQAPGYLLAKAQQNYMVIESYRTCRFVGANVPHIDPLKEVQAERLKLGETGASLPLTTMERATEALNGGESYSNMDQYAIELKKSKDLGIEPVLPPAPIAPVGKVKND